MISFKQFIKEAFDTKVKMKRVQGSYAGDYVYEFYIMHLPFFITIERAYGMDNIAFGTGKESGINDAAFKQTDANRYQFQVLSAVINGLIDHYKQHPLGDAKITFSSDSPSRSKAYKAIANRLAKQFGFEVEEMKDGRNSTFIVGKNL